MPIVDGEAQRATSKRGEPRVEIDRLGRRWRTGHMNNPIEPPAPSDLIGSEQDQTEANPQPGRRRPDAHAFSTVNYCGSVATAVSPTAISPGPGRDALLAGMESHADPPTASDPIYIDEKELSRRTTLSRTTLQVMRKSGGGPPFARLSPRRIAYRVADVERWIQERTR
jgi:predicted DNA-binding transcriptional regulator AlpA